MDDILPIANRLRDIVAQVAFGEFYWQDAHYNHDSRLGRELLYLIANDEWIRSTTEIIDISRADAVDTTIKIDVDLDKISHEAFRADPDPGTERIWLPLFVLPASGSGSSDPDPLATLTVTNARGTVLATVPSADVCHQISAALAEIIINMAVARWPGTDGRHRPVATRDQRLVLSAAIFRLLTSHPAGHGHPAGVGASGAGRLAVAKADVDELIGVYIADYMGQGEALQRPFARVLTERAVRILDAFTSATVVVVDVNREHTPTVLSVVAPTRRLVLTEYPARVLGRDIIRIPQRAIARMLGPLRPRAQLRIDLLLPSSDANRQVQVNLPDGVSLDTLRTADPVAGLRIRSAPPRAPGHLADLMDNLLKPKQLDQTVRHCLADLALTKADNCTETLRQHLVIPEGRDGDPFTLPGAELEDATERTLGRLAAVRDGIERLAASPAAEPDDLRWTWGDGGWLKRPLLRRTSMDVPSPRTIVGRSGLIENVAQRVTPDYARVNVPVDVPDAEFGAVARFSSTMSGLLMLVVLSFFLYAAIAHHGRSGTPSAEVLAGALTLFSVIQAGRIEIPDRSTLRGLLSGGGYWLVVGSILPTVVLAVALAFELSGWAPVIAATVAILAQLVFLTATSAGPLSANGGRNRPPHRILQTSTAPDYARSGVLHADWWRGTTASALVIGRQAHAYVVWEHASQPSLPRLLDSARLARTPEQLAALAARVSSAGRAAVIGRSARADQVLASWPPNILALLRSSTAHQALTFVVFRDPPQGWPPARSAVQVDRILDPDRLAPLEEATEPVDVFVGVRRAPGFPLLRGHPAVTVLEVAALRNLLMLDIQLPVPPPSAADADYRWARLRIGLRDSEMPQLAPFLRLVSRRLAESAPAARAYVRTSPEGLLRVMHARPAGSPPDGPAGSPAQTRDHLLLASEIDVVPAYPRARQEDSILRTWRVLAICADARSGIERDILRDLAAFAPRLQLAAVNYAVLHGTAVILLLGHQPGGETPQDDGLAASLAGNFPAASLLVAIDEWQSAAQLGHEGPEPVLRVHVRSPDRPGTLLDVLNALQPVLRAALPELSAADPSVWYANLKVTAGQTTSAQLTMRLPVSPAEVAGWDATKFGEIEREARLGAARAVAERRAGILSGEEFGAPEDTVISVSLIRSGRGPGGRRGDRVTAPGRPARRAL